MNIHPKIKNHYRRFLFYKKFYNYTPKNILDIGASDGRWSTTIKEVFPNSNFLMIGPNKAMEEKLKKTNIDYISVALSDKIKKTEYYKLPGHVGNALYREKNIKIDPEIELIETSTLSTVFDDEIIFNLIKLDVQGSEIDILNGGIKLMKKADLILTECSVVEFNINGPLILDQLNFFNKHEFTFIDVVDLLYGKNGRLLQVDVLFKNNNFFFKKNN